MKFSVTIYYNPVHQRNGSERTIRSRSPQLSLSDDLIDLLKELDIDKSVQKQLSCHRTKCTSIVQHVIKKFTCDKLNQDLQKNNFTLIIDDSTDLSTKKNLAMCARLADDDVVGDEFLALLEVKYVLFNKREILFCC